MGTGQTLIVTEPDALLPLPLFPGSGGHARDPQKVRGGERPFRWG